MASMPPDEAAPARVKVESATERALETLRSVQASHVVARATAEALRAAILEAERLRGRMLATIAVVGERRSAALLDACLREPLFGDLSMRGPGPLLSIRNG